MSNSAPACDAVCQTSDRCSEQHSYGPGCLLAPPAYRMVRRWWRDWCIGWHQGAIQRHTRLLAKYDPERERREYAAYLATSPAHVRSACWDGACPISTVHWKREPGCIRLTDVTGNAKDGQ